MFSSIFLVFCRQKHAEQINEREARPATFIKLNLCGSRPRYLNRWVARGKFMRFEKIVKVFIFILLFCFAANAQSSDELRQKYGAPTSKTYTEVYPARTYNETTKLGASVTVTYTRHKEVCRMQVDIFPYFVGVELPTTKEEFALKDNTLKDVVNEIIPLDKRGTSIKSGFYSGADVLGTFARYEKVEIYYLGNYHHYAIINFKEVNYI